MISIGIDQSYACTGMAAMQDGKLIFAGSTDFKSIKQKFDKRIALKRFIAIYLEKIVNKYGLIDVVVVERVRQFSMGSKGMSAISMPMIRSGVELITAIVDEAYELYENGYIRGNEKCEVPVYSVDTRSWKSKIVGTSKPDASGNKKAPTIEFVNRTFDKQYTNDNVCDAVCIAMYGELPKQQQKLLLEAR